MEVGSSASSYEILAKLAEGGMAEIFLARSKTGAGVERMVVLKRVLRHAAQDEQLVKLFVDEARLAAQLQHPNVVQVYDVGKLGSSYFFSMEYVHGETVRDVMLHARHRGLKIPIATVMTLAAGAAAGLSHAHERRGMNGRPLGIVHADVSPSNLMITYDGVVKIVDFGIAKAEHSVADVEHPVKGKLCYMSPEQVRSRPLDRRSDLFSLGIVLWELLTLQGLFRGDSDFLVMNSIITEPVMAPSQVRPDVPRDVDDIVMRLLAKEPERRYQSAAELLDAIEAATMRMSSLLSTATVARQMREWFGQRSEPWIESTVGGSIKRVVVHSEPVPASMSMTIAGPVKEPIDDMLDTLQPSQSGLALRERLIRELNQRRPRHPSSDAIIADDAATIADPPRITLMGAPAIQPPQVSQPPASNRPAASAPYSRPSAPPQPQVTSPVQTIPGTMAAPPTSAAPSSVAPSTLSVRSAEQRRLQQATPAFPSRRAPTSSDGSSKMLLVLLAIVITLGIGGGGFYLLWKTQLADRGGATSTNPDIDRSFAANNYPAAVNACLGAPPAKSQLAVCAISACAVKDSFHARRWRDEAPAGDRAEITARCRQYGSDLDAPIK